jgi:hypothetical protein
MKEAELLTEILASAVLTTNPARVTAQDFAGAYGGFGFSYGAGNTEAIWVGGGPSTGNDTHEFSGFTFGGFLGHNWQNGRSAFGVEAGLEVSDTNGDDSFTGGFGSGTRISSFGHVSGRIGRVNDLGMLYASFGEALADVQLTERDCRRVYNGKNDVSHVGGRLGLGGGYTDSIGTVSARGVPFAF